MTEECNVISSCWSARAQSQQSAIDAAAARYSVCVCGLRSALCTVRTVSVLQCGQSVCCVKRWQWLVTVSAGLLLCVVSTTMTPVSSSSSTASPSSSSAAAAAAAGADSKDVICIDWCTHLTSVLGTLDHSNWLLLSGGRIIGACRGHKGTIAPLTCWKYFYFDHRNMGRYWSVLCR